MVDYLQSLATSWRQTRKHKSLVAAYLLQMVCTILLFIILIAIESPFLIQDESIQVSTGTAIFIFVLAIIDIALLLAVNAWFKAGIMGMLNAVVEKKQPDRKVFFKTTSLWHGFLFYEVIRFLLICVTAIPFIIFFLLFQQANIATEIIDTTYVVPLILSFFLFLFCSLYLNALLFFSIPAIIREKLPAITAMKKSYHLFKSKNRHVIRSFVIYLCFMMAMFSLSLASIPAMAVLESQGLDASWRYLLSFIAFLAMTIISIVASLFMLDMYKKAK